MAIGRIGETLFFDWGRERRRLKGGDGEVVAFTVVNENAPSRYEEFRPYLIGLVRLDNGEMVMGRISDVPMWDIDNLEVEIGTRVEIVVRRLGSDGDDGVIDYGDVFRPVLEKEN